MPPKSKGKAKAKAKKSITDQAKAEIRKIFKIADSNKDGVMDIDEMKAVFTALGKWNEIAPPEGVDIDVLFSAVDTNGDGKIQVDEFLTWLLDDITDLEAEGAEKITAEGLAKLQAADQKLEEEAKAKEQLRRAEIHTTMEAAMNTNFDSKPDYKLERVGPIGDEKTYFRVSYSSAKTGKTQNRYICVVLNGWTGYDTCYYQRKTEEDIKDLHTVYPYHDFEEMLKETPNM